MQSYKKNRGMKVVFLGCTYNYGFGFSANITKIGYMAKGLTEAGANCAIHNGIIGSLKVERDQTVDVDGFLVTTFKKRGNQIFSSIRNLGRLYRYLKEEKEDNGENVIVISFPLYHIFLLYWIVSKVLGYKFVAISHEWGPTLKESGKIKYWLCCLFAKTFGWYVDAILPISEYIIDKTKHFKKPYLKVPILAEFKNEKQSNTEKSNSILYCASVEYKRILIMLINAYKHYVENDGNMDMTLVLSGPEKMIEKMQEYIKVNGMHERITIKTKLPYKVLTEEFEKALALIIPLNPDYDQDKARFSQKIAEYLSSKSAILTNRVGEINYYFKENEIITCDYNEISFAEAFKWIEVHKEDCRIIGNNGYKRGETDFNYKSVGKDLRLFLESLCKA